MAVEGLAILSCLWQMLPPSSKTSLYNATLCSCSGHKSLRAAQLFSMTAPGSCVAGWRLSLQQNKETRRSQMQQGECGTPCSSRQMVPCSRCTVTKDVDLQA